MQRDLFDTDDSEAKAALDESEPRAPQADSASHGCYWDFCPNCSARLHNVGCKYRCTQCHYFMSCSDFD